jgi:hypothetical protein
VTDFPSTVEVLQSSFPDVDAIDPVAFLSELSDPALALVHSGLFWPRFVEVHGALFVALYGDDEADIRSRIESLPHQTPPAVPPLSWTEMVDSFNTFEVQHLFRNWRGPAEVLSAACWRLGQTLVQAWSAKLAVYVPDRRFRVDLLSADDSGEIRIVLSQESPELAVPAGWDASVRRVIIADQ